MNTRSHSWWLGLVAVVLALACFGGAMHFQGKYQGAGRHVPHSVREAGTPDRSSGAAGAETATRDGYLLRAWWMFYGCLGVWVASLVVAWRKRCRANWVAVVIVGIIAVARLDVGWG